MTPTDTPSESSETIISYLDEWEKDCSYQKECEFAVVDRILILIGEVRRLSSEVERLQTVEHRLRKRVEELEAGYKACYCFIPKEDS